MEGNKPKGTATAAKDEAAPRYRIRVSNRGLTRPHGPHGLHFVNGDAETDSPAAVAHAIECGYEVTDRKTNKVTNELPEAKKAREEAEAAAAAEAAKQKK